MATSDWLFSSSDLIRLQNPSDPILGSDMTYPDLKVFLVLREDPFFSVFLRLVFDTTTRITKMTTITKEMTMTTTMNPKQH